MVKLQALEKLTSTLILNRTFFINNATYMRYLLNFYIWCYHKPSGQGNSIKQMDLLRTIKNITISSFEHHYFCVQPCLISSDGLFYGLYCSLLSVKNYCLFCTVSVQITISYLSLSKVSRIEFTWSIMKLTNYWQHWKRDQIERSIRLN